MDLRPCQGQCFECPYPDCVRTPVEILRMEAKIPKSRKGYHHSKKRKSVMDLTPEMIRKARGSLTQKEFGALIHASNTAISRWELGKDHPSEAYAARLRKYMEG